MNNTGAKILLAALLFGSATVLGTLMYSMEVYSQCVVAENGIEYQYKENQNNYDSYIKKLMESAGVAKEFTSQMKEVFATVVEGRKGSNQELVRFIQEKNPDFRAGTDLYKNVQNIIISGRDTFASKQTSLLDRKRAYLNYVQTPPAVFFTSVFGFPKKDLSVFDIVTSAQTQKAFETKQDDAVNPFAR